MKVAVLSRARVVVLSCVTSVVLGFGSLAKAEESAAQTPLEPTEAAAKAAYANKLMCTKEPVPGLEHQEESMQNTGADRSGARILPVDNE
jgi:hypothetical protein